MTAPPLPAVLIGGYLGAGKTTTINHLLRHAAGQRLAVLVNDFGELAIDADLIEGAAGEVLSLAGGCVCCSYGGDLVGELTRLTQRTPLPDRVLIECNGVALPAAVSRSARLARGIEVEGAVVLVDAERVRACAEDPFVGELVQQQLREADLLLLNKVDRVDAALRESLTIWLQTLRAQAPVVSVANGQVMPSLVLGVQHLPAAARKPVRSGKLVPAPPPAGADRFESTTQRFDRPIDVAALAELLVAPDSGVLRAKGLLQDTSGEWQLVQVVGRRATVSPAPAAEHAAARGRLVVIRMRVGD
jgi:G3E family GTPase